MNMGSFKLFLFCFLFIVFCKFSHCKTVSRVRRQFGGASYAEPWETEERGTNLSGLNCKCVSALECGASWRSADDSEENPCPNEGEVCCTAKTGDGNNEDVGREDTGDNGEEKPDDSWNGGAGEEILNPGNNGDSWNGGADEEILGPGNNGDSCCEGADNDVPKEDVTGDTSHLNCTCMTILQCGASLRNYGDDENVCPDPGDVCCEKKPKGELPTGSQGALHCGESRPMPQGSSSTYIEEGSASNGELPWTVLIFSSKDGVDKIQPICGGTLVNSRAIVTSAHCVDNQDLITLTIRAGEWDIDSDVDEGMPHQDRQIFSSVVHPKYKEGYTPYDIALLIVSQPFDLADNVNPICLPSYSLDTLDTSKCVASGWGNLPNGDRHHILKKITMPVVTRKECRNSLRKKLGPYFVLDKSVLCAGGEEGKDVCEGDGGGPLTCPSRETGAMTFVGVTSWGVRCGTGFPSVFTDMIVLSGWLSDVLKEIE